MRRLLHGDMVAAARVLLAQPPGRRAAILAEMLAAADRAERHVARTSHAHPRWGAGCLESAAARWPSADEPWLDDADYAACLMMVLQAAVLDRNPGPGR